MNKLLFSFTSLVFIMLLLVACSKTGGTGNSNTGNGNGGGGTPTDTTNHNPTPPVQKVIKVVAVDRGGVIFRPTADGKLVIESIEHGSLWGGGARFDSAAMGGLTIALKNPGNITASQDAFGAQYIFFSNALVKEIPDVTKADTMGARLDISGFNKASVGYTDVYMIICKTGFVPTGGIGSINDNLPLSIYTPSNVTGAFPAKVKQIGTVRFLPDIN